MEAVSLKYFLKLFWKIAEKLQGVIYKSQLYGIERDLARQMTPEMIVSDDGAQAFIYSLHKRNGSSLVNDVYNLVNDPKFTRRRENESFENYESWFAGKLS